MQSGRYKMPTIPNSNITRTLAPSPSSFVGLNNKYVSMANKNMFKQRELLAKAQANKFNEEGKKDLLIYS